MATVKKFEDLGIWQLSRQLAKEIFDVYSSVVPFSKDYKLKDQINASSGSVMDNIAAGFERGGRNEFVNFLSIAKGSTGELQSQLYSALDRNYIIQEQFQKLYNKADQIAKKISDFIIYLNKSEHKGTKFKERTSL